MWSGSISFGLINIPVRLYSATEEHSLNFDMLHKTDLSPIRFARICKADGKEIPYKDIVKGYEYQKGEYVVIDEEDFKRANVKKTGNIDIVNFAMENEIDSVYFEKPYYLEPDKGANKPYALLREVLLQSNKVAVAKFVFRNKEHLGIIKPYLNALILDQLRFARELRDVDDLKLPEKNEVNKKEVEMALKLVEQLTEKFDVKSYKDTYTDELKEVIDKKIKGHEGHVPAKKGKTPKPSKVHDIMSLLKASLEDETKSHKAKKKTAVPKTKSRKIS